MNRSTVSCLCLMALLAGAHHADGEKSRIRGGSEAKIADYPYQVSIQRKGRHGCGGAIIGSRHILTASHCLHNGKELMVDVEDLAILIGSTLSSTVGESGKLQKVERLAVHEGWSNSDSYINDIAVVTLTEDIEFNDVARAIHLPTEDITKAGVQAVTTGWGLNSQHASSAMLVLQKAAMEVIPYGECQKIAPAYKLYPGHVCGFQSRGVGVCTGDSGGPLAVGNVLVGVTSWGMIPCGDGKPDVYANVYHYRDWILEKMRD